MKKLLLLAALMVASGLQAKDVCGYEEVRCATPDTTQTVVCKGCPACVCPIPQKTKCDCVAQVTPVQESYCAEKKSCKPCGHCHSCKAGHSHKCSTCNVASARAESAVEKKQVNAPTKKAQQAAKKSR
jgi:hypothetical protein